MSRSSKKALAVQVLLRKRREGPDWGPRSGGVALLGGGGPPRVLVLGGGFQAQEGTLACGMFHISVSELCELVTWP